VRPFSSQSSLSHMSQMSHQFSTFRSQACIQRCLWILNSRQGTGRDDAVTAMHLRKEYRKEKKDKKKKNKKTKEKKEEEAAAMPRNDQKRSKVQCLSLWQMCHSHLKIRSFFFFLLVLVTQSVKQFIVAATMNGLTLCPAGADYRRGGSLTWPKDWRVLRAPRAEWCDRSYMLAFVRSF
jgi:hypothetical protein